MGTVEEEADETMYWIELSIDAGLMQQERVQNLLDEANEILSITVSSINTARGSKQAPASGRFNNSAFRNPKSEIL